jgi:hypothetical protein
MLLKIHALHLSYFRFILFYDCQMESDATPWLSAMIAALAIFMFSLGKYAKMQDRNSQS